MENEPKERDAQDWLTDDEMMTKWEEVSKDQEEVTVRRSEGGKAATRETANCTRACDSADTNEGRVRQEKEKRTRWQVGPHRCWRRKQTCNNMRTRRK